MKLISISLPGFELDAPAAAALEHAFNNGCPKTGLTETYRSYAEQVALFLSRYTTQAAGSGSYGDVRPWLGVRYVRTSPLGMGAIPGTSIHGSGRAIDCNNPMRAWLRAHPEYGFIFPIESEPWHGEWIAVRYTAKPAPTPTEKRDDMAGLFTTHARSTTTNGPADGEWTLGHAEFGRDLAPFNTPATPQMSRVIHREGKGVVVEYKGFLVTTIPTMGLAWSRTYAEGPGTEDSRVTRNEYIDIQKGLSLVALAAAKANQ